MNDTNITIAGTEDIGALDNLVNSAYRGESARKGWTHEADLLGGQRIDAGGIKELLEDEDVTVLKYVTDNRIIGCVSLQKKEDHLYLGMLTVDPSWQGQGIGKAMLKMAETYAYHMGCTMIEMTVITDRLELIDWYVRHGYINTGKIKAFPSGDARFGIPKKDLQFTVLEKSI